MEAKKNKGKQKIEMKKIEKDEDRLIAFSKRRAGIYKKVSELITLCGADVGFLAFSTAGKSYSFGHPSFESIASRFLNEDPLPEDNMHPLVKAHQKVKIDELNRVQNELDDLLDAEKKRGKDLKEMFKGKKEVHGWWETPIEDLNIDQLQEMNGYFQEFNDYLWKEIIERTSEALDP